MSILKSNFTKFTPNYCPTVVYIELDNVTVELITDGEQQSRILFDTRQLQLQIQTGDFGI